MSKQANNNQTRGHAQAKAAYRLKQQGHTTREIATLLGIEPKVVKARVQLGERLSQ